MRVSVKLDRRELKKFEDVLRDQVPFCTAVALTRTAAQARDKVREELPRRFILRNQFTKNSIRYLRAEKRDWPNSKSVVGSISDYMEIQEEGGTKAAIAKAFAIPKGIRTDERRLVPRSKWPGKILIGQQSIPAGGRTKGAGKGSRSKPKPFLIKEHNGVGIYIRAGKGRKLKRLYRLTRETLHVRGRHWLESPTLAVVNANLRENFVRALEDAMKSGR